MEDSKAARILFQAAEEERFPQSVILTSRDLAGLESLAERLAGRILEKSTPADAESPPLRHHPDLFTLRPAKKMRQISADNTRELIRKIHHSPRFSNRKVAMVHEAERMHPTAFNIFLKTLEEPPADTIILLVTTQPYGLLPTIRSRCLTFRFPDSGEAGASPAVTEWLRHYRLWLQRLSEGVRDARSVSAATLTAFGLLVRFQETLDTETRQSWENSKESLPPHLEDDQISAFEEGVKVSVRRRFMLEIERATHAFARELAERGEPFPARALTEAVSRLETCAGLLHVNLKEQAALEHFLLHSLRIWARSTVGLRPQTPES